MPVAKSISGLDLKYMFGAHLASGEEVFQNAEDLSPTSAGKNCYYDLLRHNEAGEILPCPIDGVALPRLDIEIFQLEGDGHRYVVDLRDGHFQVDDVPFFMGPLPPANEKLMLVFHYRVSQHIKTSMREGKRKREIIGRDVEYHFGWTTEDKSRQQVMILV